ncbi:hypothetical protein SELMODRAFT_443970 [Selaginella moellendorffii]|uniref:C3H1-type domain-containing protein n=1 Tax=Selaginella moellendorffii TaxID=88036 RepID=D8S5Y3_SELML|nr:zinc finger CCCH domain-containing protein 35 [Selaginella moellendorffii]XP_002984720.1 zinc finger CCCH domain-containing protein 35 [Selaginella moellendorffii]EFJ14365.1 hypothetical protein SELMODRAFT_446000 [Selaginella moellendorffii]EFJ20253.1 hypothetical protein SELMODRAFT_443970 [Selaginella moellendorffii]|eukprot:XP_002978806.1 zinc finger CCCH domain-containing protein 35 [Selaginella moellendorffii]
MDLHVGMGGGSGGNAFGSVSADSGSCDSPTSMGALHKFLPSNNEDSWSPEHLYACDEFRMFEFKVRRCMRGRSHDWTECPFAHPGEKARRRDPRRFHYSGTSCPDFRKGCCKNGDSCDLAHGVFECWLHPARYRTQPCKDGRNCKRKVCFFAHTPEQLRLPSPTSSSSASSISSASSPPLSPVDNSPPLSPCGTPRGTPPRDAALLKSIAHAAAVADAHALLAAAAAVPQRHVAAALERMKSMPHVTAAAAAAAAVEADRRSRLLGQSLSFNSRTSNAASLVAALHRQMELNEPGVGYSVPPGGYSSPPVSPSPYGRSPLFRSNDCARSLSPSLGMGSPSIWSRTAIDDEYYAQRFDQSKNLAECGGENCPDLGWVNELVAIN